MADGTKIEWTDATWQIVTGCSVLSPGCTNCYAMRLAGTRLAHHPSREGLTRDTKAGPVWTGEVRFNQQWLLQPLQWKKPRMIFVAAHGDLFHESIPDEWLDQVFAVMALAPQHTFQLLTKRPERMLEYLTRPHAPGRFVTILDDGRKIDTPSSRIRAHSAVCDLLPTVPPDAINRASDWQEEHYPQGDGFMRVWPLPNVWLGTSVEDQKRADERIPQLLATPAAVRFVSAEPLLGPVDLTYVGADGISEVNALSGEHLFSDLPQGRRLDWVIVGGESGPGARPMHPDWARSLRDQCAAAGVPFLFKQWGGWLPMAQSDPDVDYGVQSLSVWDEPSFRGRAYRIGKHRAGRLLDGVEHNGFPEVRAA